MLFTIATQIGQLLLFVTICSIIWTIATVEVCRRTGIKLERIAFFFGKPVWKKKIRGCEVAIGSIPAGGYVARDMTDFPKHPLHIRWLVLLAGPVAVILSAAVCLGFHETARHLCSALPQFAQGTLHPFTRATPLLNAFFEVSRQSLFSGYAIFATKYMAMNILPVPAVTMGQMIIEVLPKRENTPIAERASTFLNLLFLPLMISWAMALANHFWQLR